MSLLSYNRLVTLIRDGVIKNSHPDLVNSSSIDIRLGNTILIESNDSNKPLVYLDKKDALTVDRVVLNEGDEFVLRPGQFILASSLETFHLPNHISGEYKLKSSMARLGLEHMNSGWCDAGWNGSVLTLELKNMTERHYIVLKPGDKIGQIVFFEHEPVPHDKSYAIRGSYNGDLEATGVKIAVNGMIDSNNEGRN